MGEIIPLQSALQCAHDRTSPEGLLMWRLEDSEQYLLQLQSQNLLKKPTRRCQVEALCKAFDEYRGQTKDSCASDRSQRAQAQSSVSSYKALSGELMYAINDLEEHSTHKTLTHEMVEDWLSCIRLSVRTYLGHSQRPLPQYLQRALDRFLNALLVPKDLNKPSDDPSIHMHPRCAARCAELGIGVPGPFLP